MKKRAIIVYGSVFLIAVAALGIFLPDYDSPRIVKFLILVELMFLLSLVLYRGSSAYDLEGRDRHHFRNLLILAMGVRIIMFVGSGETTWLSDDVYRYVWDGKLNANGVNPYQYSPSDGATEALRDSAIYPGINHRSLPTIYPPMAQAVFTVAQLIGGDTIVVIKILCGLFELLTAFALMVWLGSLGVPRRHLLLYLYSPLILVEFWLSTHLDIFGLPFLIAGLIALRQERGGVSGLLLALACLVKFVAILILPIALFQLKGRRRGAFAGVFTITVLILYLPYLLNGGHVFGSLTDYLEEWQFNGSVYALIAFIVHAETARIICGILLALLILWLIRPRGDAVDRMFRAFSGYLILTPVFFSWYFVWIYPFLLRRLSPAFLWLSGATLLSYHYLIGYYATGTWSEISWLRLAMYVPFYALLIGVPAYRRLRG